MVVVSPAEMYCIVIADVCKFCCIAICEI